MKLQLPSLGLLGPALLAAACASNAVAGTSQPLSASAKAAADASLADELPQLIAFYKDLHAQPELGFQEHRTSETLAQEMRALGFEVTEHVGGTGVVAVLRNGPGPTVMVRTDMDGLPVEEKTGLPYASSVHQLADGRDTFVTHACGHDVHMTVWRGTARAMVRARAKWHGTLVFVAQPAEETVNGAAAMLADGFLKRFPKPNFGLAMHVLPDPAGTVVWRAGLLSSSSDTFSIKFHGRGTHGSRPQDGIDPILQASRFVVNVQSVVAAEKIPLRFGVVSVGAIQAGNAGNVIPDQAVVRGTIRTYDAETETRLIDGVKRVAAGEAAVAGAPAPDISVTSGGKALYNDDGLIRRIGGAFQMIFAGKTAVQSEPGAGSEDYSEFVLAGIPSFYFGIGGTSQAVIASGGPVPVNHSPLFAPDPAPTIRAGVQAMTVALFTVLGG